MHEITEEQIDEIIKIITSRSAHHSKEEYKALCLLAQKNKYEPDISWFTTQYHYDKQITVCNICGKTILNFNVDRCSDSAYRYKFYIHGINHLKEHKLIPFL